MKEQLKLESLKIGSDSMGLAAEHFPGNELNAPSVWLEIGTGHTDYDRDWGTTEPIVGSYDLDIKEARKLHSFLGQMIQEASQWKRPVRLHEFKPHMEGFSDSVLEKWIADGKAWIVADGSLIVEDISGLQVAVLEEMEK